MSLTENKAVIDAREKSIARLEALVEAQPQDPDHIKLLGNLHLYAKDFESARAHYERLLALDPNNDRALHNLGLVEGRTDHDDKAADFFARAIKKNPDKKLYQRSFRASLSYLSPEQVKEKIQQLAEALPHRPDILFEVAKAARHIPGFKLKPKNIVEEEPTIPNTLLAALSGCRISRTDHRYGTIQGYIAETRARMAIDLGDLNTAKDILRRFIRAHGEVEKAKNFAKPTCMLATLYQLTGKPDLAQREIDHLAAAIKERAEAEDYKAVLGSYSLTDPDYTDPEVFKGSTAVDEAINALTKISGEVLVDEGIYGVRYLFDLFLEHKRHDALRKGLEAFDVGARQAVEADKLEKYCNIRLQQVAYYRRLKDTGRAKEIVDELWTNTHELTADVGEATDVHYTGIIRNRTALDPDYDYREDVKQLAVRFRGDRKKRRMRTLVMYIMNFLTLVDDFVTLDEIVTEQFDHLEGLSEYADEEKAAKAAMLLDVLEYPKHSLDKDMVLPWLDRIYEADFIEGTEDELEVLSYLGKWYAGFGEEEKARVVAERILTRASTGFKKKEPISLYLDQVTLEVPDLIRGAEAVAQILWGLKDYKGCAEFHARIADFYERNVDFGSVRRYWFPDQAQATFNRRLERKRELDSQVYFNKGKIPAEELVNISFKRDALGASIGEMTRADPELGSPEDYTKRLSILGHWLGALEKQAEAHVQAGQLNQALDLYQRMEEIVEDFGICDHNAVSQVKERSGIVRSVAHQVGSLEDVRAMLKDNVVIEGYIVTRKLGEGGSGRVYLAQKRFARVPRKIKVFKTGSLHPLIAAQRERRPLADIVEAACDALAELNHPNIARYFDHGPYTTPDGEETFYIVSEYVEGVTIEEALPDLDTGKRLDVFMKLMGVLWYLHEECYILRDQKLNNTIISPNREIVKVTDLETITAIGKMDSGDRFTHGSNKYAAPELMKGSKASMASDIYALGACLLYLMQGEVGRLEELNTLPQPAYEEGLEHTLEQMQANIRTDPLVEHILEPQFRFASATAMLVRSALAFDPAKRLTRDLVEGEYNFVLKLFDHVISTYEVGS